MRIAERRRHAHGAEAPAQRGRVRLRAAALRDRGRDGRRARGRGRVASGRRGAEGGRGERKRRGARRRADPGGEPQRLRALERGRRRRRHGHDDHRRAGRRPGRDVRARRRLARVRRCARASSSSSPTTTRSSRSSCAAGKLSAEEAEHHPQRSVITRALGTDPDVDVDTFTVEREAGRRLPDLLGRPDRHDRRRGDRPDPRATRSSLDDAARALVGRANDAGGQDNITVVAFEITDEPDEPDERTLEQHR